MPACDRHVARKGHLGEAQAVVGTAPGTLARGRLVRPQVAEAGRAGPTDRSEEISEMRVIAIEEHFAPRDLEAMRARAVRRHEVFADQLDEVGEGRLADMDRNGISMQILSSTPPNPQTAAQASVWNDRLAEVVSRHPGRFGGFASLCLPEPASCPAELERAVSELGFKGAILHGHANGRFLDHRDYWPLFETAESLDVPLYLHPTPPPSPVYDAYYGDLEPEIAGVLSTSGWGWHAETGMHALRLIVSGLFDRFPRLQVVIGHMGENVPFSLARADSTLGPVARHLERSLTEYFTENFYVTTSAYFTHPPLLCALAVIGADRVIFSVDYPFSQNAPGRAFLDSAPISPADREKIAHGNAERLLRLG